MFHCKDLSSIGGVIRAGIVHRIDADTSGLLMVAKNNKAHNILADDFKNKRVKNKNTNLVYAVNPLPKSLLK